MFKAKIRKQGDILLNCKFEITDYPLVNLCFSSTSFRTKYIRSTIDWPVAETKTEDTLLLDIVIPVDLLVEIDSKYSVKYEVVSALRPTAKRLSPSMRNIISEILHCSFRPQLKRAYLTTKVADLLIQILSMKASDTARHSWSEQDRRSFEKVRDLISQNLKAKYSIEELAIVAGMNRTKLQEGFKSLFSKTIYTFIMDLKMVEARTLLTKENNLSLKEIAAMLGYRHVNHFSMAFKKKFDISPSYFKKVLQYLLPMFFFFV